jgi:dienelactone hydrolase
MPQDTNRSVRSRVPLVPHDMARAPIDSPRPAATSIRTEAVEYEHGDTKLKGFLAYPEAAKGGRPGVLVFSEWWGLNEYAKSRARRLAALGYVAFAADVYGDGVVIDIAHPDDAAKMAGALRANTMAWRGRARAALEQLTQRENVDASKVAAIGYCLDSALQLAYSGAALKAVATFHSLLPTPTEAEARAIEAKLLVCLGGADPFIPEKAREDFRAALRSARVELDFVTYDGVLHSFTSPEADRVGNPDMRYDKRADEDSWERMKALFARTFGRS